MDYRRQALVWVLVAGTAVFAIYVARFVSTAGLAAPSPAVNAALYLAESVPFPENVRMLFGTAETVGLPPSVLYFGERAVGLPEPAVTVTAYLWGGAVYIFGAAAIFFLATRLITVRYAIAAVVLYLANGRVMGEAVASSPTLAAGAICTWTAYLIVRDVERGSISWSAAGTAAAATLFGPAFIVVPAAAFWAGKAGVQKTARFGAGLVTGLLYAVARYIGGGPDGVTGTLNATVTDPLLTTGEKVVGVWYCFFAGLINLLQGYYAGVLLITTLLMILPLFVFGTTWLHRGTRGEKLIALFTVTVIFGGFTAAALGGPPQGVPETAAAFYPIFIIVTTAGLVVLGHRRVFTFRWLGKILAPTIFVIMVLLGILAHFDQYFRTGKAAERTARVREWAPKVAELTEGADYALTFGDFEAARLLPVKTLDAVAPGSSSGRARRWGVPAVLAEAAGRGKVVVVCPAVVAERYPATLLKMSDGGPISLYRIPTPSDGGIRRKPTAYFVSFYKDEDRGFLYRVKGGGRPPGLERPYSADGAEALRAEATRVAIMPDGYPAAGLNSAVRCRFVEELRLPAEAADWPGGCLFAGYFRSAEGARADVSFKGKVLSTFNIPAGDAVHTAVCELPDEVVRSDGPVLVTRVSGEYESYGYLLSPEGVLKGISSEDNAR